MDKLQVIKQFKNSINRYLKTTVANKNSNVDPDTLEIYSLPPLTAEQRSELKPKLEALMKRQISKMQKHIKSI